MKNRIRDRARQWAAKRQGRDTDPVVVNKRRIYILPTPFGIAFALVVFAMLLGAMNYNSSLGLALTFLLAGMGVISMHHCHGNLVGLVIRSAGAEGVFAGQDAVFRILVENASPRERHDITIAHEQYSSAAHNLDAEGRRVLNLAVPTERRGELCVGRFSVSTTHPFHLFRAWTWVHMDLKCTVYPRPAKRGREPPPERTDTGGAQDDTRGDDDFAGFRTFRPGDSPKHVAWKAFAKEQELLVKQYSGTSVTTYRFEWDSLPDLGIEQRLSQLCRWVVDAHTDGHAYGLRLPGEAIEPNLSTGHRQRCLSSLALFGLAKSGQAAQHG